METSIKEITGLNSKIEKATFTIEPFSPVFIGSGRSAFIKGVDFYCSKGLTLMFDHQKIYNDFIGEMNKLEQAFSKRDLKGFLQDQGKNLLNYVKQQTAGDVKGLDLSEPITDGFGNPILPGSSLKGSIRTALFASLFKQKGFSVEDYAKLISGKGVSDFKLTQKLLTTYRKSNNGSRSNYDIGRALRVGDATFKPKNLEVFNTVIANETNRGFQWKSFGKGRKNSPNIEEATQTSLAALSFDPDVTDPINFNISIDHVALESIDWKQLLSFKTIAKACNRLSKKLIREELKYFEYAAKDLPELDVVVEDYKYLLEDVEATIKEVENGKVRWFQRVGWGSGWLGMTGAHAYDKDKNDKDYMEVLRKKAGFMFNRTGDFTYPKTRKVVLDKSGKPANSTGWVYIEKQ